MEQYILSNYQDVARKCNLCHSLAIQVTCFITSANGLAWSQLRFVMPSLVHRKIPLFTIYQP